MVEKIERVSTGIPGLDKLIEGGIPKGFTVLVTGGPGTGKTVSAVQFVDAALRKGMKCVYIPLEERGEDVIKEAEQFDKWKDRKNLTVLPAKDVKYDEMGLGKKPIDNKERMKLVYEKVKKLVPDIVVIDSINPLKIENGAEARLILKMLIDKFKEMGITTMFVGESFNGPYPDETIPFLVDAIVILKKVSIGKRGERTIMVDKMRKTNVDLITSNMSFTKKGIVVG